MRVRSAGLAWLAGLVVIAGCGGDDESEPAAETAASAPSTATATVEIAEFAFEPETITVAVGDEVTWTNTDTAAHTASGAAGSFDTGALAQDEDGSGAFDVSGTYEYICEFHPFMKGTVSVE